MLVAVTITVTATSGRFAGPSLGPLGRVFERDPRHDPLEPGPDVLKERLIGSAEPGPIPPIVFDPRPGTSAAAKTPELATLTAAEFLGDRRKHLDTLRAAYVSGERLNPVQRRPALEADPD